MKSLSPALQSHLDGGVTTLCRCWRLERSDGVVLGFTDHDRALAFDGVDYAPASGLEAGEEVSGTGFAPGGLEVGGALSGDGLSAEDLAAGFYDHAEIRVFLVNWSAPEERVLLRVGHLGEVAAEDGAFRAEIRGLASLLDQPQGRTFRHGCDADLGDSRCGVDLSAPAFRGTGTVTAALDRRRLSASGLAGFADGWFARGRLTWLTGENAGRAAEVGAHWLRADSAELELWLSAGRDIAAGDTFSISAGCDKLFATCRAKFDNAANFRGFPHMPGNEFALAPARHGEAHDGAAVVP